MKSKPMAGFLVVLTVAVITWSIASIAGPAFFGDREEFLAWRSDNATLFFVGWGIVVVVISLPALVIVGQRLQRFDDEREAAVLGARGVGRLASRALRGDKTSIAKLEGLLDDPTPAVRYQSARALSLLDDAEATKTLLRKVRYWSGPDKLALIDVLKRTHDLRCVPLMEQLAADRNTMIARKARTAMPQVAARAARMEPLEGEARKRSAAQTRKNVGAREREARRAQAKRPPTGAGSAAAAKSDEAAPGDEAAAKSAAANDRAAPEVQAEAGPQATAPEDQTAASSQATAPEGDQQE